MKKLTISLFFLILSFSTFANEVNWDHLNLLFKTEARYEDTSFGTFAILEHKTQLPNSRSADYLSAVGGFDSQGEFQIGHYEVVSERWIKVDKLWHIDQWLYTLSSEYSVGLMSHRTMIQNESSIVLDLQYVSETDEVYKSKLYSILKGW